MPALFTIGYERRSLSELIRALQEAGVDAVIDIRLRNTSQLAGYTKKDDLAFLLREGFGIAYEHHPELAPTDELLDDYRASRDWEHYESAFRSALKKRHSDRVGREILGRYSRICLLCHERLPVKCHRRLVAEWWVQRIGGFTVVHL
ncbi:MAG: hypothetical protein BWY10_01148 [Chloroflexi bacterium ADurb.Bin180]|nr:MAG: hypothetical protein BWY10_01148 [Chloroflexi bacterium ADurb.Bin180]